MPIEKSSSKEAVQIRVCYNADHRVVYSERLEAENPGPIITGTMPKKTEPARALAALKRLKEQMPDLLVPEQNQNAAGSGSEERLRALAEELGMKLGDMLMPLRVAVTGSRMSPPLFESIRVMGLEKAQARTARAIGILTEFAARS